MGTVSPITINNACREPISEEELGVLSRHYLIKPSPHPGEVPQMLSSCETIRGGKKETFDGTELLRHPDLLQALHQSRRHTGLTQEVSDAHIHEKSDRAHAQQQC